MSIDQELHQALQRIHVKALEDRHYVPTAEEINFLQTIAAMVDERDGTTKWRSALIAIRASEGW